MSDEPTQPRFPAGLSPREHQFYPTGAIVTRTLPMLQIDFTQCLIAGLAPVNQSIATVVLSWANAKTLHGFLGNAIEAYEKEQGEPIQMPKIPEQSATEESTAESQTGNGLVVSA